jgi:hypothetical protein
VILRIGKIKVEGIFANTHIHCNGISLDVGAQNPNLNEGF